MQQELERLAQRWGVQIAYMDEVESTNDVASDPSFGGGDLIVAERQRAGRGQRGNRWSSAEGLNLTFSVVLTPDFLRADRQFYLSKTVTLALTDALRELGVEARIKWPNDIYVGDRKLVGILIENDLREAQIVRSVVGIGINVNQCTFPDELPNPTSIALELHGEYGRAHVLQLFFEALNRRYVELSEQNWRELDTDYKALLYRFGEEHTYIDGATGVSFRGTICGVQPSGELEIRHADDTLHRYLFKEVEYTIFPKG